MATWAEDHDLKFPVFSRVDVNGENTHELFKYLKHLWPSFYKSGTCEQKDLSFNYQYFLVRQDGTVFNHYVYTPSVWKAFLRLFFSPLTKIQPGIDCLLYGKSCEQVEKEEL